MSKVRVVTDSTSDLPSEICSALDITVVPLYVHFGEQTFKDGVDITPTEFFTRLKADPVLPHTSQPSPADFAAAYQELTKNGDPIVSVHISSELSGTLQSANMARQMLPEARIEVCDSRQASLALGHAVVAAARASREGKGVDDVAAAARRVAEAVDVYFVVDTLEYLRKNGRIGGAAAFLGSLLSLKPVLTLVNGTVQPFERVRGRGKALARLVEVVREKAQGGPIRLAVMDALAREDAERVRDEIQAVIPVKETLVSSVGPIIGSHVGPGLVGVAFYREP